MGDLADEVLSGYRCDTCACVVDGKEPGHPRTCDDCSPSTPGTENAG